MRRDRAAIVRSTARAMALVLATSGLLVSATGAATAAAPSRDTERPTPTYRVAPADLGPREAEDQRAPASSRRSGISALASGTGHIAGTVTNAGGEPLEEVWVQAYRWDEDGEWWDDVRGQYTKVDGAYDLSNLAAGSYRIEFDPGSVPGGYESEYWDDATSFADATPIELAAGQTVAETDAELAVRGRITGTVTGPAGQPLADIHVTAYLSDDEDGEDYWYEYTDAWTDSDGSYDLGAMDSGTYRIEFFDHETGYVAEYWHDTATWADAAGVQVTSGTVTSGIDAQLAVGGSIDGVVTAAAGQPLEDIEVRAYRWDQAAGTWEWAYYTYTDGSGHYDMSALPDGSYRIGFSHEDGYYATEYWDDATTLEDATTIPVTAGDPRHGRDARLSEFGTITGTVTRPDGEPIWDAEILAYLWSEDGGWEPYYNTYADDDGSYVLGGLEPGTYRLQFDGDWEEDYLTEYWDDATTLESAKDIHLGFDQVVDGIDAELATPTTPAIANVGPPTIAGNAQVGVTLIASSGTWSPSAGLTFAYQWFSAGNEVPGANSSTYTPTDADLGRSVRVQVRAMRSGYVAATATSVGTAAVAAVPPSPVVNMAPPTIVGPTTVGLTAVATPGSWSPGAAVSYQWLVAGSPVSGETSSSYSPRPGDAGKALQVRVVASKSGSASATATSAASVVAKGVLKATKKPKVTGKAKKNAILTVFPGTWSPQAKVTYQWYAGSKVIAKATAAKLKLTGKTLKTVKGKAISVLLTITAPGYTTVTTRLKVSGKA